MRLLTAIQRRPRCHRCSGLRFSGRPQVLRWLYRTRVRALEAAPLDNYPLQARATLREVLTLVGQLAGLCSTCATTDATLALEGAKRQRRRRAA